MAQDVLAVYESYYEKAIIHRDELKKHVVEQAEHLRTISEELGENSFLTLADIEQLPLNLQASQIVEKVDALERIKHSVFTNLYYIYAYYYDNVRHQSRKGCSP